MNIGNITEWISALSALVSAVVGIVLLFQIALAKKQLYNSINWNKINATFTYLTDAVIMERERATAESLKKIDIDLYSRREPVSEQQANSILHDTNTNREVKDFLNVFEGYATAINSGAIDENLAYHLRADRFIRHFEIFKSFINASRNQLQNEMYWIEMERIYRKWKPRRQKEREEAELEREKRATEKKY